VARAYRSMAMQFGGGQNTLDMHQFVRERDALDSPFFTVHRERTLVTYRSVVGINKIGEVVAPSEYLDAHAPVQFVKRQQSLAGHEGSGSRRLAALLQPYAFLAERLGRVMAVLPRAP
jgi:hypothetical protein